MEKSNAVVFSAFDDRKGPVPLFFEGLPEKLASKVAVKSIVSTLSAASTDEKVEGEAIIPFPDEQLVSFIYYTSLDQKTMTGDNRVISLCFLTGNTQVNSLYQNAPKLSNEARKIAKIINTDFKYGEPLTGEIKKGLLEWAKLDTGPVPVQVVEQQKMDLFNIFDFFPVKKGFRLYDDPLGNVFLSFLMNVPVVLVGPDPQFLLELSTIFEDVFDLKELLIELTIPLVPENARSWSHQIPRADIVALTDDQYRKAFFSKDPICILTTKQEVKMPNHIFNKDQLDKVQDWLKKARSQRNSEFAKRIIQSELAGIMKNVEQLVKLADGTQKARTKEILNLLKCNQVELDMLIEIVRNFSYVPVSNLNTLLSPSTQFREVYIQGKTTIGFIR